MKSTSIACAIGAILVSIGTTSFAQGFDRSDEYQPQQRFERRDMRDLRDLRVEADAWAEGQPRGNRAWRRHRNEPRVEAQQVEVLQVQQEPRFERQYERRYEQPAYAPLTVVVQMPSPPAVAVVDASQSTVVRPPAKPVVAKVVRPVVKRHAVAKSAVCAPAPAHAATKPRAGGPA